MSDLTQSPFVIEVHNFEPDFQNDDTHSCKSCGMSKTNAAHPHAFEKDFQKQRHCVCGNRDSALVHKVTRL